MKRLRLILLAVLTGVTAYVLFDAYWSDRPLPPRPALLKAIFLVAVLVVVPLLARLFVKRNRR